MIPGNDRSDFGKAKVSTFNQSEDNKEFAVQSCREWPLCFETPTAKSNQNITLGCFRTNIDSKKA